MALGSLREIPSHHSSLMRMSKCYKILLIEINLLISLIVGLVFFNETKHLSPYKSIYMDTSSKFKDQALPGYPLAAWFTCWGEAGRKIGKEGGRKAKRGPGKQGEREGGGKGRKKKNVLIRKSRTHAIYFILWFLNKTLQGLCGFKLNKTATGGCWHMANPQEMVQQIVTLIEHLLGGSCLSSHFVVLAD